MNLSHQTKMPRIGVLLVAGSEVLGPFQQALRDLGYIEGKTIQINMQSAEGRANLLPELAAELRSRCCNYCDRHHRNCRVRGLTVRW